MIKIEWYARGAGVARMGPFSTQAEAARHLRLAKPTGNDEFPSDAFVWPEEVKIDRSCNAKPYGPNEKCTNPNCIRR